MSGFNNLPKSYIVRQGQNWDSNPGRLGTQSALNYELASELYYFCGDVI